MLPDADSGHLSVILDNPGIKKAPGEGGPGACSRIRFGDCNRIHMVHLGREADQTMHMVRTMTEPNREKFQKFDEFPKIFFAGNSAL